MGAVFGDAAFAELFHRLFCSDDWQSGTATSSILATLGDYFDDFERCLEPSWFKRCARSHGVWCLGALVLFVIEPVLARFSYL